MILMNQPARPIQILVPQRDHDFGHRRAVQELTNSVEQDGRAVQQHELLAAGAGFLPAHARPQARGREYDGDFHDRSTIVNRKRGQEPAGACSRKGRSGRSLSGSAPSLLCTECTRSSKRPKIIFPAVVCRTLVTAMSMVFEIIFRALSTTTMVPSSRYATPWLYSFPSLRMKTRMVSPWSTTGFKALASSLMFSTSTPWSWATLLRLKSLVMILQS